MFKKIKEFASKVVNKIKEVAAKVKEHFKKYVEEHSAEEVLLTGCTVLMTVAAVAVSAKILLPAHVLATADPVIKMTIPTSVFLALAKNGGVSSERN